MKLTGKLIYLSILLAFLLGLAGVAAAEAEPKVGLMAGNVKFSAPITPEDQKYLGLDKPGEFTLKDIKAPYVMVESFNTTCPHCMMQAPILNKLFELASNDPQLKDKLKFISVGQGNDENAIKMWKGFHKVPFAVVPDADRKLSKALNFSPYPVSTVMDKNGKVLWVEVGTFESAEKALKEIKAVVK